MLCVLFLACPLLDAATLTWTGGGGDGNWNNSANWGGSTPAANDDLVFAGSTNLVTNNNYATDTAFNSITFSATAGAFTLGGNRITLAGNLTNSSSSTQTVNHAIVLSGATTVTCSNPVVIAGIISGSGSLVMSGASSLSLSTNNLYTGGTTVNQGTLNAAGTGLGTGLVTVAASGTLAVSGGTGLSGGYYNVTSPSSTNFATLTQLQAHIATLAPAVVSVPTTLNFGTTGSAFPSPYNSGGANFEAYYSGKLNIGTAGVYTFNTNSDDGSMLWVDGTLVVSNNGSHGLVTVTGNITLSTGLHDLVVGYFQGTGGYGLVAQISGAGNTTMVDISTANATLSPAHLEVYSLAGAGTVSLGASGLTVGRDNTSTTFSGSISGTGNLVKIGTGTLTLTGSNAYSGVTKITAGGVQIGAGGTSGTLGTGTVIDNGTLTYARSDSITIANLISGTGAVVMNGAGTVTQCADNTYTGTTTISQGTMNASGSGLGTSAVTVAAVGTLAVTGGNGLAARYFNSAPLAANFNSLSLLQTHLGGLSLALADTATTLNFASNGSGFPSPYPSGAANFEAIFSGKLTIGTGGVYTFNTSSDDGSVLWVDGTMVVNSNFFQGYTTRTGAITLASGVHDLVVAYYQGTGLYGLNAQISGAGNTTMVDISTANATLTPDLVVGSLAGSGAVALTSGSLLVGFNGTSTTFSGVISGSGGIVKRGAGTLTLTGASTYTDTTVVSNGTLKLGSGASLGNTAITVCSAATLDAMPGSGTTALGTTGAGTAGASLSLNSGAIYDMTDAAIGTCNLQQNASFAGTALTLAGATMNFEINSTGVDTLAATLGSSVSGTNSVGITMLGSSLTVGGSYPLITATGGLSGGTWQFTGGVSPLRVASGANSYMLSLSASPTALTITVASGIDVWNGTTSTDWNDPTNWSLGLVPTASYDIQIGNGTGTFFTTPSVTAANGTCRSITFTGTAATIGAGGGTLTIGTGGITTAVSGSAIACPVALGANQTWSIGAGSFSVSGVISGAFALTKSGSGTLTLSGSNSYSGPTTIIGGTVASGVDNALPTASSLILGASDGTGSGTLDLSTFNQTLAAVTSQSNSATANAVNVTSGKTLTINGASGLLVGVDLSASTNSTSSLTIAGGGALVVANASANVTVGLAQASANFSNTGTLDLTGLASVTLGSGGTAINELRVGYGQTVAGLLYLSNTANTITATTVRVGDSAALNTSLTASLLQFGTGTNVVTADTVQAGYSKANGTINFASQAASSPGTVTIGGKTAATTIFTLGSKGGIATASTPTGILDLRGHVATVTASTVTAGLVNDTSTGNGIGTISMDGGTFTATTVGLAAKTGSGTGSAQGTINLGGGTFTVLGGGSFTLGSQATGGTATGTLNITGGTFNANCDLVDGGGSATTTVTVNGGTLDMKSNKIGGATVVDAVNLQSGTLQNVAAFNNGAAVSKTTAGTLTLAGTNTYTSAMTVSAGTLLVTGTTAAGSAVTVNSAATLGGTGTIAGTITVANGGTVAPGTGGTTIGTPSTGALTFNSTATYSVDLNGTGPTYDQIATSGAVTCAGTLTIASIANAAANVSYPIISAGTVSGTFSNAGNGATVVQQGRTFQIIYTATAVTLMDVTGTAASSKVWTGGGGDNNWSTAANWGGTAPLPGDTLVFDGSTRLTPNNDFAGDTSFAAITFNVGASAFTIGGNRITLTGNITNNSLVTQTLNQAAILSSSTTIGCASGAVVVGGTLSGTGSLIKSGANQLTLPSGDIYSGTTTINTGTVNAGGTAFGTGAVTVAGGATISVTAGTGMLARYYNVAPATANFNTLPILLAHLASQTLSLEGTASTLNFGTTGTGFPSPYASGATNFESLYSGRLNIGTAGVYTFNTSSDDGSNLWVDGTLVVNNNAFQGLHTSTGAITLGVGVHTLVVGYYQGTGGYGLSAQISGAGNTTMVDISTANATITPDLEVYSLAGAGSVALTNGSLVVGRGNASTTFSGAISGGGDVNKIGTGTLTLSGTDTWAGQTFINGGTLQLGSTTALPACLLSVSNSGILDLNGFDTTVTDVVNSVATATITDNSAGAGPSTFNVSAMATTITCLVKNGATHAVAVKIANANTGTQIFPGANANTFSGGLILANNASGGTRLRATQAITTVGTITSSPYGTGTISIGQAATDHAGVLLDTVANNTLVNAVTFNTALGTDVVGFRVDTTGNTLSGAINATLAAATFSTGGTGAATLTGQISGPFGLTLDNTAGTQITITLKNSGTANNYQGDTTIGGTKGILTLGAANQIPDGASAGNLVDNGTFNLGGFSDTINGLSGNGTVDGVSGTPTLTLGGNNATATFSGVLKNTAGTLAVTKTGTGTETLSGASTYTGATTLNAGTVLVTGSTAAGSAVTVNSSATLGGTGTAAGTINVANGGTLAPGTGGTTIGTLTTGAVTFHATSIYSVDLNGTGPTCDQVSTAGTVTCAGTLTVASIANAAIGKVYTIVSAGTVSGTFAGLVNGAMTTQQGRTFQIAYTATTVTLTDVARPTTRTWDGGGADNNWTTAANWDYDLAPSAGDDLIFAGSTRLAPNNDYTAGTSFNSISFSAGAGNFVVGGNAVTIAGGASALTSNATSGTMTLNTALTFATNAPTITSTAGGTFAIGGTMANGGLLLTVVAGGPVTSSAAISGIGGLAKSGSGTLTLSGTNTYSGTTSVTAGTLSISADANLGTAPGSATPGSLTLNGGTLQCTGAAAVTINTNRGIALGNSGGTITVSIPVSTFSGVTDPGVHYSGIIADVAGQSGSLTVNGAGMFVVYGTSNTYSGTTTVDTAWLSGPAINGPYANLLPATTVLNLVNSGHYNLSGSGGSTQTLAGLTGDATGQLGTTNQTNTATFTLNVAGSYTFPGVIGALTHPGKTGNNLRPIIIKSGSGTQTFSGTNTYTGSTTVSAGTLSVTGTIPSGSAVAVNGGTLAGNGTVAGTITMASGATIAPGTGGTTIGTLTTGAVTCNASSTYAVDLNGTGPTTDQISAAGQTVTCAGTLSVTSLANAAYGKVYTIVSAGTVTGTFSGLANGASIVVSGRRLQIAYTATTVTLSDVPQTFVWTGGGGDNNWSTGANWDNGLAPVSGSDLVFAGSTRLAPNNDLTAGTSFNSITFNAGAGNFVIGGNALTLAGGASALTSNAVAGTMTINNAITFATAAPTITTASGGTLALGGTIANGGLLVTVAGAGSCSSSNVISGTGGLTMNGSGTLTLTGASTYGGATTVSAGTLNVNGGGSVIGTLSLITQSGGTCNITNATVTLATSASSVFGVGYGAVGTGTVTVNAGASLSVGNGGGRTFIGGGNGSAPFGSGILTITGGTVTVAAGGAFPNDLIYLAGYGGAGTLNLDGGTLSTPRILVNGVGSSSIIHFNGGTLQAGMATANLINNTVTTVDVRNGGAIIDTNGFAVGISHVLAHSTVGGDNATDGGLTKIGAGTLTLSQANAYTGATTINVGTLLVTGSTAAGSAVTVNSSGTLGGTGTVAGTVTVANGGTLAPGTGGTTIGTLTTGAVTFNASSTYSVDLNGTTPTFDQTSTAGTVTCAGTLTVASVANAAIGKVYTIVSAASVSGTFSGLANNAVISAGGRLFRIAYTATAVTLTDCAPVLIGRQTLDTNGNGQIDRIRLTFDVPLNDDTSGLTVTVAGYTVTGYSTGTANDAVMDVLLTESGSGDTGATPQVRITANTSLAGVSGMGVVQAEGSATAATDGAAPVLLSAAWTDGGTAGVSAGDTLTLTFSESVTTASMTVADLGLPVSLDSLSTTAIADQTGSTITMTLAGTPRLTPGGTYSSAATTAGKPSGVYMASGAHVHDVVALAATTGNAASAVDIGPGSTSVAIAWATGSDPKTWALGTLTVGTVANTVSSGLDLTVRDVGNCNVNLTIATSAAAPSTWAPAAAAAANVFLMKADGTGASTSAPTDPASYGLTLSTSAQALASGVLSGATTGCALYFAAPTSITNGSATLQTITITITAALAP